MIYYSKTNTKWTETRKKQAYLRMGKIRVGTVMSIENKWIAVSYVDMLIGSDKKQSHGFCYIEDAKAWLEERVGVFMKKIEV